MTMNIRCKKCDDVITLSDGIVSCSCGITSIENNIDHIKLNGDFFVLSYGMFSNEIYKNYSRVINKTPMDEWWREKDVKKIIEKYLKHAPSDCYHCSSYNNCVNCKLRLKIIEYFNKLTIEISNDEIERRIERIQVI